MCLKLVRIFELILMFMLVYDLLNVNFFFKYIYELVVDYYLIRYIFFVVKFNILLFVVLFES